MTETPGNFTCFDIELRCTLDLPERLSFASAEAERQGLAEALRTVEARRELAALVMRLAGSGKVGIDGVGAFASIDNKTLERIQDDEVEGGLDLVYFEGGRRGVRRIRHNAEMGRTVAEWNSGSGDRRSVFYGLTREHIDQVDEFIRIHPDLVIQALNFLSSHGDRAVLEVNSL